MCQNNIIEIWYLESKSVGSRQREVGQVEVY